MIGQGRDRLAACPIPLQNLDTQGRLRKELNVRK